MVRARTREDGRGRISSGTTRPLPGNPFLSRFPCLITFERWKSNIDYEKELGRKAKHLSELRPLFAQSRLGFERCWYGAGGVTAEELETYSSIYERIKHAGG